jgi:hypothetical protein
MGITEILEKLDSGKANPAEQQAAAAELRRINLENYSLLSQNRKLAEAGMQVLTTLQRLDEMNNQRLAVLDRRAEELKKEMDELSRDGIGS